MEKKKGNVKTIIITLIVIALLAIIGYLTYNLINLKNEQKAINDNASVVKEESNNDINYGTMDILLNLTNRNKINNLDVGNFGIDYIYQNKKITLDQLTDSEKINSIVSYTNPKEYSYNDEFNQSEYFSIKKDLVTLTNTYTTNKDNENYDAFEKFLMDNYGVEVPGGKIKLYDTNYNILNKNFKEFFNTTIDLPKADSDDSKYTCKYVNSLNDFICFNSNSAHADSVGTISSISNIKKLNNGDIDIYEYFVSYVWQDDSNAGTNYYADSDDKDLIVANSELGYTEKSQSMDYSVMPKIAKLYKHTFKLNSDGTYYWYSTEPVNE